MSDDRPPPGGYPPPTKDQQAIAALGIENRKTQRGVAALERTLERARITGDLDVPGEIRKLATALHALAAERSRVHAPNWHGIDEVTREAQLTDLAAWVDEVLVPFFPDSAPVSCWRNHPRAVWELSQAAAMWKRIYESEEPDLDRAADWLDRWLPGAAERVRESQFNCQKDPGSQRVVCAVTRRRDIAS